jgi:hypothetical protein
MQFVPSLTDSFHVVPAFGAPGTMKSLAYQQRPDSLYAAAVTMEELAVTDTVDGDAVGVVSSTKARVGSKVRNAPAVTIEYSSKVLAAVSVWRTDDWAARSCADFRVPRNMGMAMPILAYHRWGMAQLSTDLQERIAMITITSVTSTSVNACSLRRPPNNRRLISLPETIGPVVRTCR